MHSKRKEIKTSISYKWSQVQIRESRIDQTNEMTTPKHKVKWSKRKLIQIALKYRDYETGSYTHGPATTICEDCVLLCKDFVGVIFEHCPREANNAAYVLAREVVVVNHQGVWMDDSLDFLVDVISNDVLYNICFS
jgi:hypothetical protein